MAATDQHYRSQRLLDIVFGATCLVMLLSLVWMFADDYYRAFKVEGRDFRDIEEGMAFRQLLREVPDDAKAEEIAQAEEKLREARKDRDDKQADLSTQTKELVLDKLRAESKYQAIKADYDSEVSKYNIAVDERNAAVPDSSEYRNREDRADKQLQVVKDLEQKLDDQQKVVEEVNQKQNALKEQLRKLNEGVDRAEGALKEKTASFDRFAKQAEQKRWKAGDAVRAFPVIDAFRSPLTIDQITLTDLPIDYNFKYVTRFDRCATCHLGIDKANYTPEALGELTKDVSDADRVKLDRAVELVNQRRKTLGQSAVDFQIDERRLRKIRDSELNDSRIREYCAHPRLDLFVGDKSPHPKEKFGCTICHGGQGSATDFNLASHTPNDATQKRRWAHGIGWESNHFWDFPMLPARFVESSCVKCHHQMTDLLPQGDSVERRAGRQVEAPGAKVLRGYNLVKENGCFGCHEIAGVKNGRWVGPDLRLEPSPPLEAMTAAERVKMTADPANPPGTLRKVGPSLRRIAEKTNQEWTRRWLEAPRAFRPDTKMPHFYNLSTSHPDVLPTDQKDFPAAEIHGIAYYLFRESRDYLAGKETYRRANLARQKELQDKLKKNEISDKERLELEEVTRRLELAGVPVPLTKQITTADGKAVQVPAWLKDDKARQEKAQGKKDAKGEVIEMGGRQLFTERGCLACHKHAGTESPADGLPPVVGTAEFGPNLSDLAAKIAPEGGDPEARWRWLVQWILNPNVHHPRTRMPVTHLTEDEAGRVAAWLMSQQPHAWSQPDPPAPEVAALEKLARVYLDKSMGGRLEGKAVIEHQGLTEDQERALKERGPDADELRLATTRTDESWSDKLKWYVGRKAITQLGCFGCHDIPGFEFAKPIGTPLNDWGKKDPERIAFEDAIAYVKKVHQVVTQRDNPRDPAKPSVDWKDRQDNGQRKTPYEKYFFDALDHHQRDGFLHQKLMEPRSFDYDRMRNWDERLRMPQFRFSRSVVTEGSSDEERAQAERDEAEAREAVMTFVLGLVAEPIPTKFVQDPSGDRGAVARGKQVLEKYNCAGCHNLEAGEYTFRLSDKPVAREAALDALEALAYSKDNERYADDHRDPFREYNEWTGPRTADPDRFTIRGVPSPTDPRSIRLTEALRFLGKDKQPRDVPASNYVKLDDEDMDLKVLSETVPYGGRLTDLLVPYLAGRNALYKDYKNARAALPPPLLREGERVQPEWLFRFLRDPFKVRPMTVLRMPKFNMSDDEAMALVNYFATRDRLDDPGAGLTAPYLHLPQHGDDYWRAQTAAYVQRLKNDKKLDEHKKAAEPAAGTRMAQWEDDGAYAVDALRLVTNYNNACMGCHSVGPLKAKNPETEQGPPLDLSWQRLRPEWTARWIANPERMISYPTPMPANFTRKDNYPEFDGSRMEQILGVRDVLLFYPRVADLPVARTPPPAAAGENKGGTGGKP
jgi:cbb3-type cytochrome oxidase cytochrome c subunit